MYDFVTVYLICSAFCLGTTTLYWVYIHPIIPTETNNDLPKTTKQQQGKEAASSEEEEESSDDDESYQDFLTTIGSSNNLSYIPPITIRRPIPQFYPNIFSDVYTTRVKTPIAYKEDKKTL
jgi:hypothetical protein